MKRAFTLIELLIVVGIIVVLSVVAVPNFANFGSKAEVSDYAAQIQSLIEKGITESIGSQVTVNGDASNGVRIVSRLDMFSGQNKKSVVLEVVKFADVKNPSAENPRILSSETVQLPDYMHINSVSGGGSGILYAYFTAPTVYFKDASLGGNDFKLRVTSDKTSKEATVIISQQENSRDERETVKVTVDE
jgi:prepilin-type N-terminal cleavage/methylation domain-containing protein